MKTPCGMRDFIAKDVALRKEVQDKLEEVFRLYDFVPLQTPIVETREPSELLYDMDDGKRTFGIETKGDEEKLLLRYDHTVPLARYVASNAIMNMRRYAIGPVYRKDNPQLLKGRFREFCQCDCDIVGTDYGTLMHDAEIICLLNQCLLNTIGGDFTIEINDFKAVLSMLDECGVVDRYEEVCLSIDKIDKIGWGEVSKELNRLGLSPKQISFIKEAPINKDKVMDLLSLLRNIGVDMRRIRVNPLLVRGEAYYTGIVFEAKYDDLGVMPSSIAAGGRYDDMIGRLGRKGAVPAVGVSIGLERLVTIILSQDKIGTEHRPFVYVATIGELVQDKIAICEELRRNGVPTTTSSKRTPKMANAFDDVFRRKIPFCLIIGGDESEKGTVLLKSMFKREQHEFERSAAIEHLKVMYQLRCGSLSK